MLMFSTSDIAQQGGVLSFGTPKCTHYNNDVTLNLTLNIRKTIYSKQCNNAAMYCTCCCPPRL